VGKRFLFGSRVTSLDLSKTRLTSIGIDFLQKCDQLQRPQLPEWLIDVPENLPCPGRTAEAIVLPSSILYFGRSSFHRAPVLRLMDLSQTMVKQLPDRFLSDAPNLIDVRVPNSLQAIGCHVFARTSLRRLDLHHTNVFFIGAGLCQFSPLKRLHVPENCSFHTTQPVNVVRGNMKKNTCEENVSSKSALQEEGSDK
jgi:hypothetical protein